MASAPRVVWSACLLLLACSAAAVERPDGATDHVASDPQAALRADAELASKLSSYVGCINRHSNWTLGSRSRYYSWLKSPAKGPTGREPVVYGVYPLYDPASCLADIDAAAQMSPQLPELEAVATGWARALMHARSVVDEANDYYELENYKDDRMAAGKALHPRLVEAYDAFDTANAAFYAGVVAQQEALAQRRLQRLADDPERRGECLTARVIDRAKHLLDTTQGIGSKSFARDPFVAAVDGFEQAWRELDAWRTANPLDSIAAMHARMFLDAGFKLLKAAKAVLRRESGGFRFSTGERMLIEGGSGEMIEGHPAHLLETYNDFIAAANR